MVEICWFIAMPVMQELRAWRERWPAIRQSGRARASLLLVLLAAALLFVPWPGRIAAYGMLKPVAVWPVHAPGPAKVVRFDAREGQRVAAGDTLVMLDSAELRARRQVLAARIARFRWQSGTAAFDAEAQTRLRSSQSELATALAELAALDEEALRYAPVAPFAGYLRDIDPDLRAGQWLEARESIALLIGEGGSFVETYLEEDAVKRITVGDRAAFVSEGSEGPVLELRVKHVDADATRVLPDGLLAATAGGHVLTRARDGELMPERAVYRVSLAVDSPLGALEGQAWRGRVVIAARAEAPGLRYLRSALAVLVREAGW